MTKNPKIDETYHWKGLGDGSGSFPSCCRLRIFYPHPEQPVVVLSDMGIGGSITNSIEYILLPIARKYCLDPALTVWVEHYPQHRDSDPEVEFSQILPEVKGSRVVIRWKAMSQSDVARLTAGAIDEW